MGDGRPAGPGPGEIRRGRPPGGAAPASEKPGKRGRCAGAEHAPFPGDQGARGGPFRRRISPARPYRVPPAAGRRPPRPWPALKKGLSRPRRRSSDSRGPARRRGAMAGAPGGGGGMERLYDSTRGAGGHHPLNEWNHGSPRSRNVADKVLSGPGALSLEALLGQVQRQVDHLEVQGTPPVSRSGLQPRTPEEGAGRPPPPADGADRYGPPVQPFTISPEPAGRLGGGLRTGPVPSATHRGPAARCGRSGAGGRTGHPARPS